MKLDEISALIFTLKRQSKQLCDAVSSLKHTEPNVNSFLNKVKKTSLSTLDAYNEIERQIGFLKNEIRSFEIRERSKQSRKQ